MSDLRPCKDCPDRYLGCHDHCRRYLEDKEKRLAHMEEIKRQNSGNEQLKAIYSRKKIKKIKRFGGDLWNKY